MQSFGERVTWYLGMEQQGPWAVPGGLRHELPVRLLNGSLPVFLLKNCRPTQIWRSVTVKLLTSYPVKKAVEDDLLDSHLPVFLLKKLSPARFGPDDIP